MPTKTIRVTEISTEVSTDLFTSKSTEKKSAMAKLKAKASAAAAARKADGLSVRKNPIERAQENPTSRTLAIAAKCFDCQGQDCDPCVLWRIGNCTAPSCPLYPVRPHQRLAGKPKPKALLEQFDAPTPAKSSESLRAGGRRR
jgi:hypothetical protein